METQETYESGQKTADVPEPIKPTSSGAGIPKSKYWLGSIVISILFSVLSVLIYDQLFATKIVALDFRGFIAYQRELYTTNKITDEQFRQNVDNLEKAILGTPKNHVIIMGDAVLGRVDKIDYKQLGK